MHVAQHPTGHFEFALGRALHHVVQGGEGFAKKIRKRFALGGQAAKHKVAVNLNRPHAGHALRGLGAFKPILRVAAVERDAEQGPIKFECPCVIGAAEKFTGVAVLSACNLHALVGAAVVQHRNAAIGLAHHHNGLITHGGAVVVTGLGYLAGVAHIHPGVCENGLHFQRKHIRVDEDVAVHLALAHPMLHIGGRSVDGHVLLSRLVQVQACAAKVLRKALPWSSAKAASRKARNCSALKRAPCLATSSNNWSWWWWPRAWVSL